MNSLEESLCELLRGVCDDLDSANARDSATLARPRAKLAWIASLIPSGNGARHLLDTASELASAIGLYDGQAGADVIRLEAARSAVRLVIDCLATGSPAENEVLMERLGRQLLRKVGRTSGEWRRAGFTRVSPIAPARSLTLI